MPGGFLLFNAFLANDALDLDRDLKELSQQAWASAFSRRELEEAVGSLPLELVDDVPVVDYEREHLPEGAFPPTGWYEKWTRGGDIFDVAEGTAPIDMRWLLYRRG